MIRLDDVAKVYRTRAREEVRALESIRLDVAESEFAVLVGPTGAARARS